MGYLLEGNTMVVLRVVSIVALPVAVVVMHSYQGVVLHYTNMPNASRLGGNSNLLDVYTLLLGVVVVCSSCIYLLPRGAVSLVQL